MTASEDLVYLKAISDSVQGIRGQMQENKAGQLFEGLKSGSISPDQVGVKPYEQEALSKWRDYDVQEKFNKYSGMSFDDLLNIDPSKDENPMHATMAYANVMSWLGQREEIKRASMAAATQMASDKWNSFKTLRDQTYEYIANGNEDLAGRSAEEAINGTMTPHSAKYDPKTKTINLYWTSTDPNDQGAPPKRMKSVPISEVGKELSSIEESKFIKQSAIDHQIITKSNAEAINKAIRFIHPKTGKSIYAAELTDPQNGSRKYISAWEDGKKPVKMNSFQDITSLGYKKQEDAKADLEMEEKKAKIKSSEALARKRNADADKKKNGEEDALKPKDDAALRAKARQSAQKKVKDEQESRSDDERMKPEVAAQWEDELTEKYYNDFTGKKAVKKEVLSKSEYQAKQTISENEKEKKVQRVTGIMGAIKNKGNQ